MSPECALNQLHGQINRFLFDAEVDCDAATSAATADWIPQQTSRSSGGPVRAGSWTFPSSFGRWRSRSTTAYSPSAASVRNASGKDGSALGAPTRPLPSALPLPDTVDATGVRATVATASSSDDSKQPAQPRRIRSQRPKRPPEWSTGLTACCQAVFVYDARRPRMVLTERMTVRLAPGCGQP
jgi:hypothetical protein